MAKICQLLKTIYPCNVYSRQPLIRQAIGLGFYSARDVYYRFTLHYKKEDLVAERNLGDFFITFAPSSPAPTGHPNVILISIHVNAAGDGSQWMNATGWSCYTCKGQTQSDTLANCLYEAAIKNFPGKRIRTDYSDNDPDWEENFYLLRKTLCVAVLSENFFIDNHSDLEYIQSQAGKQAIIDTHIEGIKKYLTNCNTP